jgi:hypothetical protein
MIAYLYKTRGGWELTFAPYACSGAEFTSAEKMIVAGKREARAICKARKIHPYNF